MSHTIGTTQVEEDISKNAEKIADTVMTEKFEEMEDPPHPDLEEEEEWICAPEKSTNTGSELLEPEQSKDEEAVKWYNVRFRPGIHFLQQAVLLRATLTGDRCYLPNNEDDCIMEVFTTKENAARVEGLDEVVSVEPFLGVHKFTLPPGPKAGYRYDPFGY